MSQGNCSAAVQCGREVCACALHGAAACEQVGGRVFVVVVVVMMMLTLVPMLVVVLVGRLFLVVHALIT